MWWTSPQPRRRHSPAGTDRRTHTVRTGLTFQDVANTLVVISHLKAENAELRRNFENVSQPSWGEAAARGLGRSSRSVTVSAAAG